MPLYKCSVHLPSISGFPRDDVVNSFYVNTTAAASNADFDSIGLILSRFYKLVPTGSSRAIKDYFAHDRDYTTNAAKVDFYLMPTVRGDIGHPVYTYRWTLTVPSLDVQMLPDQVACCMSYRGDLTGVASGAVQKHKGRVFLGPLNVLALEETTGAVAPQTVAATFNQDIRRAANDQLYTAMNATAFGGNWRMWSPTDWVSHSVVAVSVDDRFDTQRRRLARAGVRSQTVF